MFIKKLNTEQPLSNFQKLLVWMDGQEDCLDAGILFYQMEHAVSREQAIEEMAAKLEK